MAGAGLLYLLLLTAIANIESARPSETRIMPALKTLLPIALLVHTWSALPDGAALAGAGLIVSLLMLALIGAERPWLWVARIIKSTGRFERVSFDPRRSVHKLAALALVFALTALSSSALNTEPVAFTEAAAAPQLLFATLLYLALSAVGVGWLTRRDWPAVLRRLGLRRPRRTDWLAGITTAIALHLFVAATMNFWQAAVGPGAFEAQTGAARALFAALSSSLLAGGLLAMGVGIGEEVLFRGALQPVFGILISSLLFMGLHLQYAFTPAAGIILAVSLGFGLLRARVSTTAAIIAHAAYNVIPFALAGMAA